MSENVLVIGNGFDIAHGLETKYEHFLKCIRTYKSIYQDNMPVDEVEREFVEIINSNGFIRYFLLYTLSVPGWVDLERMIENIIFVIQSFCDDIEKFRASNVFLLDRVPRNMERILSLLGIKGETSYTVIENNGKQQKVRTFVLKKEYYHDIYGLNYREIKRTLRKQLDDLTRALQIYLQYILPKESKNIEPIRQIAEITPKYIISFNYTDTYKVYGIEKEKVFHIHGSLEGNNMVLGFQDDNPDNLDFVYFKKYFQRIQKLTGYIDAKKIYTYSKGVQNYPVIHFYGHSMDKTDGESIRKLKSMAKKNVIYKYDQDDYEQKVINLIEVFGKEEATELIQTGFIEFVQCE